LKIEEVRIKSLKLFKTSANELTLHMKKEELIFFPSLL